MNSASSLNIILLWSFIGSSSAQLCSPGYGSSESTYKLILMNSSCINLITYGGGIRSGSSLLAGHPTSMNTNSYDGTGSVVRFYYTKRAIYISGTNNILVSEQLKIRSVDILTGTVSTFLNPILISGIPQDRNGAGTSASISYPISLFMSNDKTFIFVCNSLGIRKTTYPSATVSGLVVSGYTSEMQYNGVISPDGSFIIFTEPSLGLIKKYTVATSTLSLIAGTGSAYSCSNGVGIAAKFSNPRYPVISPDGLTLYVSDIYTTIATIRKVNLVTLDTSCIVGSCPGTYTANSESIQGMVSSPSGKYLVFASYRPSDRSSVLKRVDIESGLVTVILPSDGSQYWFGDIVSMIVVPGPPGPCASCDVGTFSVDGSACNTCPAGSFCISVSLSPTQCPSGKCFSFVGWCISLT
jgi:hypothetical protein